MRIAFAFACIFVLAACTRGTQAFSQVAPHPANNRVPALPVGSATVVVTLENEVPTAIVQGPFTVTSVNPGSDVYLGLAAHACDEPGLVWFGYSGGGLAVGAGQVLCARSVRDEPHPQAFSGRSEPEPEVRPGGP